MEGVLEEKIKELQELMAGYDTTAMLKFITFAFLQMEQRHDSPVLKDLPSPMRQLFYAADLSLTTPKSTGEPKYAYQYETWSEDWEKIKKLLIEIEQQYIVNMVEIAEAENMDEQFLAAAPTFMNYFLNGELSYQEQAIDKLEKMFAKNESFLLSETGVTAKDVVLFFDRVTELMNDKLNVFLDPTRPQNWQRFTQGCIDRGITDPKDWIAEMPDTLRQSFSFMRDPGQLSLLAIADIPTDQLPASKVEAIVSLLSCVETPDVELRYYTQQSILMRKPIVNVSAETILIFHINQFLHAANEAFFDRLKSSNADKAYKQRDNLAEEKTLAILQRFFGKEAHYYTGYTVDNVSEQDILVLFKGMALIVEVKAGSYREPMRHVGKAYEKLKADFKEIIQKGYDQTWRVKRKFNAPEPFSVFSRNRELLYTIDPKRYQDVFSVVVTLERMGNIQSDLGMLLNVEEEDEYPWSVSIDDLETFLLALKAKKLGIRAFRNFLVHRSLFHGHVFCSDELELGSLFIDDQAKFIKMANEDSIIGMNPNYTQVIEKIYKTGLGFANERFWKEKKEGNMGILFGTNAK